VTRDYAFEALAEVTGTDWKTGRGELNAALKSIREETEVEDSYILADLIHERAKMYRQAMPDVMLTPSSLSKHWKRVLEETSRKPATQTNVSAAFTNCATCGGDRLVVVALRKPQQSAWMRERGIEPDETEMIEEMAPCPDCNAGTDTSFRRGDGSLARALDPAKVREMMAR
jgi:hypothetical protein